MIAVIRRDGPPRSHAATTPFIELRAQDRDISRRACDAIHRACDSTFLDFESYRSGASVPGNGTPLGSFAFNVALVLDRANDPTALLAQSWGARQHDLKVLNDNGTLWSTYGANQANYNQVLADLASLEIRTVDQVDPANGYVSSAAARTIWVRVDAGNFTSLFGPTATVKEGTDQSGNTTRYWDGNLSLPSELVARGVHGLWFDTSTFKSVLPNPGSGPQATLAQGWQISAMPLVANSPRCSPINWPTPTTISRWPARMCRRAPSAWSSRASAPPCRPAARPSRNCFDRYRETAGVPSSAAISSVAGGGQTFPLSRPATRARPASARSTSPS